VYAVMHVKYLVLQQFYHINRLMAAAAPPSTAPAATAPASCAIHHSGGNADVITVNELTPQPVEPGRDLVLSDTIDNHGGGVASGIVLTIIPDSPIILKNENDRIMRFEKIIGYGARVETYLLHIDPAAVTGNYEIELGTTWTTDGANREQNLTVPVVVRGMPKLVISEITINPETVKPEDAFDLSFLVSILGHTAQTAIFIGMVRCRMESLDKSWVIQKNLNLCSSV